MEPEAGKKRSRSKEEADRPAGTVLFLSVSDGRPEKASAKNLRCIEGGYPAVRQTGGTTGISAKAWDCHQGTIGRFSDSQGRAGGIAFKGAPEALQGAAGFARDWGNHGSVKETQKGNQNVSADRTAVQGDGGTNAPGRAAEYTEK